MVTKPQNVYVMRDIACAGYVAGCNTQFFTNEAGTHTLATGQNNIMRRLSFADDVGGSYQSMLAFPCHAGQFVSGHLDTVCSVTTRLLPWEVTSAGGGTHNSFPGGDAMFREYNNKLGLSSIHFGEDMKAAENMEFISQGSTNNATCFLGPHRRYDPFTKAFYSLEPGQGQCVDRPVPLCPSPYPSALPLTRSRVCAASVRMPSLGCARCARLGPPCARTHTLPRPWQDARWRRGESISLKAARDSMVGLELASQAQMVYQKRV